MFILKRSLVKDPPSWFVSQLELLGIVTQTRTYASHRQCRFQKLARKLRKLKELGFQSVSLGYAQAAVGTGGPSPPNRADNPFKTNKLDCDYRFRQSVCVIGAGERAGAGESSS